MAGDWIKFEVATSDKPEVWGIADQLDLDPDAVVGKLLRVWTWFDQHTEKGNAPTVTKKLLDRLVSVIGFCDSMISVDWMIEEEGFISLPNFDHHNGKTAKNRAVTAKRVAKHKKSNAKGNDEVTQAPLANALPKEEKRREEKNNKKTNKKNDDFSYRQIPNLNIEAWEDWLENRKLRKLPKYKTNQCAISLAQFTHKEQADAVAQSIKQEYTGVFPKKGYQSPSPVDRRQQAIDDFVNGGSVISEQ